MHKHQRVTYAPTRPTRDVLPSFPTTPSRAPQMPSVSSDKPTQNGLLESFNGKFRDECLNVHWFRRLADARRIIEDWRESYNTQRPHSALGGRTPTQHALHYQQAKILA